MGIAGYAPSERTRIFFFLILFVAVLWAVFLLSKRQILLFSFMVASVAAVNPVIAFIDVKSPRQKRSLFFFYILVLVALVWAMFLVVLGAQLWISMFLFIISIGIPSTLYLVNKEPESVIN